MASIHWNPNVKLIIADVDETIAGNYIPAVQAMLQALTSLLEEGKVLFFVSGASLTRIRTRIVDAIPAGLRHQIVVAHCSGAEVWGFTNEGELNDQPFYSVYDSSLTEQKKKIWREKIQQLIAEFQLHIFAPSSDMEFKQKAGDDPLAIMLEDRGPQITFEMINGYDLTEEQEKALAISVPQTHGNYDLRIPILERAKQLFEEADLPITPRLAGIWALDFALKGVNKTIAVQQVLQDEGILSSLGLTREDIQDPEKVEIWGDRFSVLTGTDRHMSEALPTEVRSIDFRQENPEEFPQGYNVVLWDGERELHDGLLEYLQTRQR